MTKKKMPILRPVEVQEVFPVTSMLGEKQRLDGCKFAVVYDGVADISRRTLSRMGLFDGGYGSTWRYIESGSKKHQTMVEYLFKEGIFYPEPFARAKKFKDALQSAIKDFVPLWQPTIKAETKYDLSGESFVNAYKLIVCYPAVAAKNPLFKQFITIGKPSAKVHINAATLDVVYRFKNRTDVQIAYNEAMAFRAYLLGQMKQRQDENIK